jgi:Gamma-glutamyl cyclotransferase, AIG2-like
VGKDPAKTYLASQLSIQPAILHNYCRHRVRECDYPGIVPETGHTVRGTFVSGLTDGDIFRLDAFEGDEYKRIKVKVELVEERGKFVEASTYLYIAGNGYLDKQEWSYEEFRRDKMHRWADDSSEYQGIQALWTYLWQMLIRSRG